MTMRWLMTMLAGCGLLASPKQLFAQTAPEKAAVAAAGPAEQARVLFRQAQLLLDAGQTEAACATFERSLAVQAGIGTKFNLADCWQRVGRSASAHALFEEVAKATRDAGQTERAALAEERVVVLSKILSRVQLQASAGESGLVVQIDGRVLPEGALAEPQVLDPGKHELKGERPGHQAWTLPVSVPAGPVLVVIALPASVALQPATVPPSGVSAPTPAPSNGPAQSEPARDEGTSSAGQALRYGLLGVGAIGIGVSATMAKQFYDSNDSAKGICPSSRNCTREQIVDHSQYVDDARRARTWAWVSGGVGGAALITAVVLWMTDSSSDSNSERAALEPLFGEGTLGASVHGRF